MNKKIIAIVLSFAFSSILNAKDCDSELDSHLIKVGENSYFNVELVFGTYLNNETGSFKDYYKPMINLGWEYDFSPNTLFYYNGAFKYRVSKPAPEESNLTEESGSGEKGVGTGAFKAGLRYLYLQNKGENYQFKTGFLTTTLNEQLLLDERGVGIDFVYQTGILKTHFFSTQIISQMSREDMGCVSKATFVKRELGGEAETLSQSFGGIQFEFDFSKQKIQSNKSDDEFEEVKQEDAGKKPFKIDFTYYFEGYDYLNDLKHFADFHQSYSFLGLDYALEGAFQFFQRDVAFGYIGKLSKTFFNDSLGVFKVFSGYTGWEKVSGESPFMPMNSNIFLADRVQYLTYDNNILFYGINYRPVKKWIFEIANYHHLGADSSMEFDANVTFYYTESAKIKLGYNLIQIPASSNDYYHQIYLEIRHLF